MKARDNIIPLRRELSRGPAANDQRPHRTDGLDAMGPEPHGMTLLARACTAAVQLARDFAAMYAPLWPRMIHWPTVEDNVKRVAFWAMVGGLVGLLAVWTHGG